MVTPLTPEEKQRRVELFNENLRALTTSLETLIRSAMEGKRETLVLVLRVEMAMIVRDAIEWLDPDMPRAPLCKALGPLGTSDWVTNQRLQRLEYLIERADDLCDQIVVTGLARIAP